MHCFGELLGRQMDTFLAAMAAKRRSTVDLKKTFGSSGRTHRANRRRNGRLQYTCRTRNRVRQTLVLVQIFSSFRGAASPTDRDKQTNKQTNSKLNIFHYHRRYDYININVNEKNKGIVVSLFARILTMLNFKKYMNKP